MQGYHPIGILMDMSIGPLHEGSHLDLIPGAGLHRLGCPIITEGL